MKRKRPVRKALPRRIQRSLEPYVEEARALSAEFIDYAERVLDEPDLGYTIDSVRFLDRACRFPKEPLTDEHILQAGFLFGEILRRTFKGSYRWDPIAGAVALSVEGLTVYPIEKIRKVASGKDPSRLEDFLMILAKKISDRRGSGKSEA